MYVICIFQVTRNYDDSIITYIAIPTMEDDVEFLIGPFTFNDMVITYETLVAAGHQNTVISVLEWDDMVRFMISMVQIQHVCSEVPTHSGMLRSPWMGF